MNRQYSSTEFLKIALSILKKDPSISYRSHVIIGFPQEEESDFNQTVDMLKKVPFEHILFHAYSERVDTAAEKLSGKISKDTVNQRLKFIKNESKKLLYKKLFNMNPKNGL
jgi:tRNA A37 methylthiotransferase MiaB